MRFEINTEYQDEQKRYLKDYSNFREKWKNKLKMEDVDFLKFELSKDYINSECYKEYKEIKNKAYEIEADITINKILDLDNEEYFKQCLLDDDKEINMEYLADNFNVGELSYIYNNIVYKQAKEEQKEYISNSIKAKKAKVKNGNYYNNNNTNYLKKAEKLQRIDKNRSLMCFIEEYIKDGYIAIFATQTLNSIYNINRENLFNLDLEAELNKQNKYFLDFNENLFQKINKRTKLKTEKISVNEITKELNVHYHHIILVHPEMLERFIRTYTETWNKQDKIGIVHFEPILEEDFKVFNETVKKMTRLVNSKDLLFKNHTYFKSTKNYVMAEKKPGEQLFYTKSNNNKNVEKVGAYIFKYLEKAINPAEILLKKQITDTILKQYITDANRKNILNYLFKEYEKSFYRVRLEKMENISNTIKEAELINKDDEYLKEYIKNYEDELTKTVKLENLDKEIYNNLYKIKDIREFLNKSQLGNWNYILSLAAEQNILKFDADGSWELGEFRNKKVKIQQKEFKSIREKELAILKQISRVKELLTIRDYNKVNILINEYNNPFLTEEEKFKIYDMGSENFKKWDLLEDKIIYEDIEKIEDIAYKSKKNNYNFLKNWEYNNNKKYNNKIIKDEEVLEDEIKRLAEKFKKNDNENNNNYDVIFITYSNAERKVINKIIQNLTKENRKIKDTKFKIYDRIIFKDNNLKHLGIIKLDIFKIIEERHNKVFLENEDGQIFIYDKKILKEKVDLAYCITVHHSQGSSFNNVVVVQTDLKQYTKDLFYVACSRARESLTTLLTEEVIRSLEMLDGYLVKIEDKIYQTENIDYQAVKHSKRLNIIKIGNYAYTAKEGITVRDEETEDKRLNNFLISQFKNEKQFGVKRQIIEKLGFKIPREFEEMDLIVADGIIEDYEETLKLFELKKDIDTDYKYYSKYSYVGSSSLNKEQLEAVEHSLKNGLTIITGAGGTGKTATIEAIYKNIRRTIGRDKMHFVAFTNSAVKVLREKIDSKNITTIHALIGSNGDGISSIEDYSIDLEYLVIDEASMLSYKLIKELLKKVSKNCRIIIIGDYKQLPAVDLISCLKDLIIENKENTIELKEVKRTNNREIKNILEKIRK